jgi:small GTP-binding protein
MADKRKICMLGATGVGKTSLVTRLVRSIFSDMYRTTIGVAIDKCRVQCNGRALDLVIWDLTGEDEFQSVSFAYMRGAGGFLIVVDGTRAVTAEVALRLHADARAIAGDVPCVLALNKSDLSATWEIDEKHEVRLTNAGWLLVKTSAKTGAGVEEAFHSLARAMIGASEKP